MLITVIIISWISIFWYAFLTVANVVYNAEHVFITSPFQNPWFKVAIISTCIIVPILVVLLILGCSFPC